MQGSRSRAFLSTPYYVDSLAVLSLLVLKKKQSLPPDTQRTHTRACAHTRIHTRGIQLDPIRGPNSPHPHPQVTPNSPLPAQQGSVPIP